MGLAIRECRQLKNATETTNVSDYHIYPLSKIVQKLFLMILWLYCVATAPLELDLIPQCMDALDAIIIVFAIRFITCIYKNNSITLLLSKDNYYYKYSVMSD